MQHALPPRANTDPLDGRAEELLDERDVLLAVLGERVVGGEGGDAGLPAGEGHVLDVDLGEELEVG